MILLIKFSNSQTKMYVDDCKLFFKFKVSVSPNAISAVTLAYLNLPTSYLV